MRSHALLSIYKTVSANPASLRKQIQSQELPTSSLSMSFRKITHIGPEGEFTDMELGNPSSVGGGGSILICASGLRDNGKPLCLPSNSSTTIGSLLGAESGLR